MSFDFNPGKPIEPGDPKKPSSDTPLPVDDWSRQAIEDHNKWMRNPYGFRAEQAHKAALHYEAGMVARTLVGGRGSKPFLVLDAEGNILVSIKPISEQEYETHVKIQGGDHNV